MRSRKTVAFLLAPLALFLALALPALAQDRLFISELMYHPVERPAFDTNGAPVLDLSDDVHEFVELHNAGTNVVRLDGWTLTGGIAFDFAPGATVPPGGFVIIAKNPSRLLVIPQHALASNQVLGPFSGQLGNNGDTVRLKNSRDDVVDSVSYSASFPWAIGADGLGADDEWTGLNSVNFQYRGRSLERVSFTHPANDPANWLASPLPTGPTPGRSNSVRLLTPRPVVIAFSVAQASDGAPLIRSNQLVRLETVFSATNQLSNVSVEYFVDDIALTNETRFTLALSPTGQLAEARFTATLPGQPNRSVVRYRLRANRGAGVEVVSPRADDPFAWHAYFVTPARTSANPIYDVFISAASLNTLTGNISQSPRRVTLPDPPGLLRASWNATEPAIFVADGRVYDIRLRYHGSRYRRSAARKSYKYQFARYSPFNGRSSFFETDKGEEHRFASLFYAAADLPMWRTRYVDIYQNGDPLLTRLEQEEMDDDLYQRWIEEQAAKFPGTPRPGVGDFFKSEGVVPYETGTGMNTSPTYEGSGEGPYYIGNCAPIPPKAGWTLPARYDATFPIQMHAWKAGRDMMQLVTGLWAARGDSPTAPNPNIPALRAFLRANFDVDATLTYIALRNWSAPFDNATHNHLLWRQADGRWAMLPWDTDAEFSNFSQSIYWDEQTVPQPDTLRGPQWVKDSFLKAFRNEYRQKLFVLNHTLLAPANLTALGAGGLVNYANARQPNVDAQLALGAWQTPLRPTNTAPAAGSAAFPGASLVASPYTHTDPTLPAHAITTWIIRSAAGSYAAPVARVTSTTNLTSLPVPFEALTFGQSYFWKCSYTDTNGHPSAESVETSFVFGGSATPGRVVLNELLADNRASVANGNLFPDYIELLNTTDQPQSLAAFSLTDNTLAPGKFFFPPGTVLPPRGFLVVWCDDATNAPGLHTGFALDKDGQTVALFAATTNSYALADSVSIGLQVPDHSVGRVSSGTGGPPVSIWTLTEPTPNATNIAAALGPVASLRVNEWMASSSTGPDWFELFNPDPRPVALGGLYLSDTAGVVTNTRLADLSFIAANGFTKLIADENPAQGARHVNFKLSASGEAILLSATNLARLDAVTFGPQVTDVSQGRLLDGSTNFVSFPGSGSPDAPNYLPLASVVISEVLSHSDPPLEDAIELLNVSAAPVDLSNWWLSDSLDHLQKFRIPTNTVLAPGGFVVFTESQFGDTNQLSGGGLLRSGAGILPADGASSPRFAGKMPAPAGWKPAPLPQSGHGALDTDSSTAFALNGAHGDEVYLSAADAAGNLSGPRASVKFGAAESGVSFGRVPTSVGVDFWAQAARTLGTNNAGPRIGPIVIAEIQYHPPPLPGDDDDYEYLRLQNITATNVPLFDPAFSTNTWRLREAVDFAFPSNVTLPPGGSLLVVGFDPRTNTTVLTGFRSLYGLDETVVLLGPYRGKLDNAGEHVELAKPDAPVSAPGPDFGFVPYVLVDSVSYSDTSPWPAAANGTGQSLQRVPLSSYGNEPTNWVAGPSVANNARPTVAIISPTNGAVFGFSQSFTITATAADSDGAVQRVEFLVDDAKVGQASSLPGQPFAMAWSNASLGPHKLVARAIDDRLGLADSAPVFINVVNYPPLVSITAPTNGAAFVLPTNIVLEAEASDSDGSVAQVEFYVDGLYLASVAAPPYRLVWPNANSGVHRLLAVATDDRGTVSSSATVTFTATREVPIAYQVNAGTVGTQSFGTGLGMDFDALTNIVVTRLGVFDSGGDGINSGTSLTAQLFARSGNSGTVLATLVFSTADAGVLLGGSRFKLLPTPLVLNPGSYSIVSFGHNAANPNGNLGTGNAKTWQTDDGGGLLAFVGTARHGTGGPGAFPPTPDGGPVDRYAAGTFEYRRMPSQPEILAGPTNLNVRPGQTATWSVNALGAPPLRYQWFFGGLPLLDATNTSLAIINVQSVNQGVYAVTVTNLSGAVTSAPVTLGLLNDPVIVQPPLSQGVTPGANVTFSVAVTNTATLPIGYRWRRNSQTIPNGFVELNERVCFFTVTNVQLPYTNYTVVVTNVARTSGILSSNAWLTFLPDSDGDGLPDEWETRFGLGTNDPADASADSDGDGMSNRAEYVAGTDPRDPLSFLKIEQNGVTNGARVAFFAVSNRTYQVQFTDALGRGLWSKLADVLASSNSRTELLLDREFQTNRFYRLVTPRPP